MKYCYKNTWSTVNIKLFSVTPNVECQNNFFTRTVKLCFLSLKAEDLPDLLKFIALGGYLKCADH